MNKPFKLSVSNPCQQKFSSFQPTPSGGFCQSCQKEVVDFTGMSDQEIRDYFQNVSGSTCGRFKNSQLRQYECAPPKLTLPSGLTRNTGLVGISLLSILPFANIRAQIKTHPQVNQAEIGDTTTEQDSVVTDSEQPVLFSGVVTDAATGERIPFANVYLDDHSAGTSTDIDGQFTFPVPLSAGDVLNINFIGYENLKYVVTSEDMDIRLKRELRLIESDIVIMGEVASEEVYASKRSLWQRIRSAFY